MLRQLGVIGMGVMGRNLAMNIADHGFSVLVQNRDPQKTKAAIEASGGKLVGAGALQELVVGLEQPRKILMMIDAGKPVDIVLEQLRPLLEERDIVIDGGNSWYEDTRRREQACAKTGVAFLGMGVSGGEEGARHGPSLMPGGDKNAYRTLAPILEAIAAKTESGPCVTHVGPNGAGHFVKMVHNGIEYADMQLIAEAYALLAKLGGLAPPALAEVFGTWNQGPLESFLIELTATVFTVRDPVSDGFLIDHVRDEAGQKGTGRWTVQAALEHGVAIPSIAAALDARMLSARKADRERASAILAGPTPQPEGDRKELIDRVHDALYAAKIVAYAQGMHLIAEVSRVQDWSIELCEIARIWKGGCIIRARLLDLIMKAYERNPRLENLILDRDLATRIDSRQPAWRSLVGLAQQNGIPVPGMSSALAYFDSYRSPHLPQNLIQAQRDAFGAHTYQRTDDPSGHFIHTDWLRAAR